MRSSASRSTSRITTVVSLSTRSRTLNTNLRNPSTFAPSIRTHPPWPMPCERPCCCCPETRTPVLLLCFRCASEVRERRWIYYRGNTEWGWTFYGAPVNYQDWIAIRAHPRLIHPNLLCHAPPQLPIPLFPGGLPLIPPQPFIYRICSIAFAAMIAFCLISRSVY